MQRMGNMPCQQKSRATAFGPGLPLQHQGVGTSGQAYQNYPTVPPYPYQPQYYGPIPPTSPTTEAGVCLPLNRTFGPSFMYNHSYPHHSAYPITNHQQSPQYYQQYHHLPPGQSPTQYQHNVLPAGQSSVRNELGKGKLKKGSRTDDNSTGEYGRVPVSTGQSDDVEIQSAV